MRSRNSLDMTEGPIVKKLLLFAMPILLSSFLQRLYSIADSVVVGNFAADGTAAQAAIGATAPAINMLLNLFMGLSIGANVVCANLRGAKDHVQLRKGMHTALTLSAILGLAVMVLGLALSKPILVMMNAPKTIRHEALLYMCIIFLGQPASMIYNFCAAIMRAHGDTKRSMYILAITGLVNVALNLVLVICCHLDVAGVAIATAVAHYLSAAAILWFLFNPKGEYKLRLRELVPDRHLLWKIFAVGMPCGINGILHSASNATLQSTVNGFGEAVIAGNNAATSINCFPYLVNDCFSAACVSFAGQCCGAKRYKRLDQMALRAAICNSVIVLAMAAVITVFAKPLLALFNPDPLVTREGVFKLLLLSWTTVFFGITECVVGCVRGMGKSLTPTVINIFCICGLRLVWVLVVFPFLPYEPEYLYLCYPISWVVAMVIQLINYRICRKQLV